MARKLLIISCSSRKNKFETSQPAWEVYDGVMFRTLKKLQRINKLPPDLDIIIISAQYGILKPSEEISYYDLKMTISRARELKEDVVLKLAPILQKKKYTTIILSVGRTYFASLQEINWPALTKVGYVPGKVGEKLSLTKQWIIEPIEASKRIEWLQ